VFRHQRNSDTRRTPDFLPLNYVCLRCGLHEARCDVFDILDRHAGQHDRKLIATEAAKNILGPQAKFQTVSKCLQERVTRLVAESVIEKVNAKLGFNVIEVKRGDELVALFKGVVYRTQKEWE